LLFILLLISLIVPPIVIEISNLAKSLPLIVESLQVRFGDWVQVETISQYLPNVTNNLFQVVSGIFTNVLFVITTLVFGFYFLLEENAMKKFFFPYVGKSTENRVAAILERAEKRMSQWFWGQFVLMVAVGTMTGIGLSLIGVKYVLALAVLAGILEAVPTIGPTIAAVPAVIIGFSQSYLTGFSALAVAVIVQQVENNFLVPVVMRRAVGINPMVTLIALIIGGKIGGVLGVLLAVPTFLFFESIVLEFIKQPNDAGKKR
jgi:predicted PurR-regulated permease PerM